MNAKLRTITLEGRKYTLGKKYRDTLMGVEGIAASGIAYLTGCDQLELKFIDSMGSVNSHWCDVTIIEAVPARKTKKRKYDPPGGPAPSIPRRQPANKNLD